MGCVTGLVCSFLLLPPLSLSIFSRSHSQPEVDLSRPPVLVAHHQLNISVPVGATARLSCTVNNVENEAVSWIRLSDYRILTNGLITFTTDKRFDMIHSPESSEWTLRIHKVKEEDQGGYQCQAATSSGVRTLSSWLWVHQPSAAILGSREKHVDLGDSVTLTCELRDNVGQPEFVFWYHNATMINFQPGITVATELIGPDPTLLWVAAPNTTVSKLTISSTVAEHAGNYTCSPSNTQSDSVRLSVSSDSGLPIRQRPVSTTSAATNVQPNFCIALLFILATLATLAAPSTLLSLPISTT